MKEETIPVYEYEISTHPAETFREVIYFCTEGGQCSLEEVPAKQVKKLELILNEYGKKGWKLVQVAFGKDGVLVFWRRRVSG